LTAVILSTLEDNSRLCVFFLKYGFNPPIYIVCMKDIYSINEIIFNIIIYINKIIYLYINMPMKPEKTYFIMTNSKGDYGCITYTDYDMYLRCLDTYDKLGWIG
jgi:hypothetical protein